MQNRRRDTSLTLFIGAVLLLNFPLVQLAAVEIGGWLPGIGIYLLLVWVGIIVALMALFGSFRSSSR